MMKIEFEHLVKSVIEEAPITKYLTPVAKYGRRVKKALGHAGSTLSKVGKTALNVAQKAGGVVGAAAGAAATALETPGKVVKGVHSTVFEPGGLAKGLRSVQKSMPPLLSTTSKDAQKFDKKIVKTMIANQMSDATATKATGQKENETSTVSTQVPGQVTGGTASGGTTSTGATTAQTSTLKPVTSAMQREPKSGDIFNVYGDYGRITRFKITKVHHDHVEAKKL